MIDPEVVESYPDAPTEQHDCVVSPVSLEIIDTRPTWRKLGEASLSFAMQMPTSYERDASWAEDAWKSMNQGVAEAARYPARLAQELSRIDRDQADFSDLLSENTVLSQDELAYHQRLHEQTGVGDLTAQASKASTKATFILTFMSSHAHDLLKLAATSNNIAISGLNVEQAQNTLQAVDELLDALRQKQDDAPVILDDKVADILAHKLAQVPAGLQRLLATRALYRTILSTARIDLKQRGPVGTTLGLKNLFEKLKLGGEGAIMNDFIDRGLILDRMNYASEHGLNQPLWIG